MKQPLISVIVPVYKVEPYLDKCVSSIVNQTYTNLEIILVDLVVLSVSAILCRISFLVVNGGILVRTLLKMVLCSLVSNAVFWIAFHRSEEFSMLRDILKRVILKLSRKAK